MSTSAKEKVTVCAVIVGSVRSFSLCEKHKVLEALTSFHETVSSKQRYITLEIIASLSESSLRFLAKFDSRKWNKFCSHRPILNPAC